MTQLTDDFRFLRSFIAKPLRVASPVPSGRRLAEIIASQIDPQDCPVLELGPGTGAVTKALLTRGVQPSQLIAIESDKDFVEFLRGLFPSSAILEGDAFVFDDVLRRAGFDRALGAIVCGVPVLSQPIDVRRKLLSTAMAWLKIGSPFIQFSYGSRPPIPAEQPVEVHHAATVWQNIPPMHVWRYRKLPI